MFDTQSAYQVRWATTSRPDGRAEPRVATVDGFLLGKRFLILDRDPLYTRDFRAALERAGVQPVRLPPRSPNLNAFAERFILSVRSECLNHVVQLGEGHLRWLLKEYLTHYNGERTRRGLGNKLVDGQDGVANLNAPVQCRKRVGDLLRYYSREAA